MKSLSFSGIFMMFDFVSLCSLPCDGILEGSCYPVGIKILICLLVVFIYLCRWASMSVVGVGGWIKKFMAGDVDVSLRCYVLYGLTAVWSMYFGDDETYAFLGTQGLCDVYIVLWVGALRSMLMVGCVYVIYVPYYFIIIIIV